MAADKKEMVDSWERLGISPVSINLVPRILDVVKGMDEGRYAVCLVGETGIGKTPIVKQWTEKNGGFLRVLNFGHMTQEEISMIMFNEDGTSFDFVAPKFMLELNEEAEKKGLAVLFLDEWNRSDKALVNALFTLTDDRRLHNFTLHRNVMVVAAMNPSDGSYLVNEAEKDHAIRKRLNFVYCNHDTGALIEHMRATNWHHLVPSFISALPNFVYDAGARDAGKAFPCPANWEKVSKTLHAAARLKRSLDCDEVEALIEGQIGSVATKKFMDFVSDQNTVIQPKEILFDYTPKSGVRRRVAGLLNCTIDKSTGEFVEGAAKQNRAGVIAELNEAVAMEIFSTRPDPKKIAAGFAMYIGDIPGDLVSALFSTHIKREADRLTDDGKKYLDRLQEELSPYPGYKKKLKDMLSTVQDYRKKHKDAQK